MAKLLQIETINKCNAKCDFCAVPKMKKKRQPMSMELFKRIIDDAAEYKEFKHVMPFLNGEPLLDKDFAAKIAYINEKMPDVGVSFFSNGSLLTEEKAKELAQVKVHAVNFSINAITDNGRKKVMGLELQPTVDNILAFKRLCPSVDVGVSAIMDTAYLTPKEMEEFSDFWRRQGIRFNFFFNGNWAGKTRPSCNVEGACSRPEDVMTILSDGTVALCCYDVEGEVSFGNVKEKSLKEIWTCEELERYRFLNDAGRRSELKLCGTCTTG